MFSSNSVFPDAQPTGSKISDTDEINISVSELESVISKTIENNKKLQEIAHETGTQLKQINSHAPAIDIVPLVETVLDDERIEIATRKPARGEDENIKQSINEHVFANESKAYVVSTVSTTETEIEITSDSRLEIATEIVKELSTSQMGTELTVDSNMVVSTTETLQVSIYCITSSHSKLNFV